MIFVVFLKFVIFIRVGLWLRLEERIRKIQNQYGSLASSFVGNFYFVFAVLFEYKTLPLLPCNPFVSDSHVTLFGIRRYGNCTVHAKSFHRWAGMGRYNGPWFHDRQLDLTLAAEPIVLPHQLAEGRVGVARGNISVPVGVKGLLKPSSSLVQSSRFDPAMIERKG